MVLRAAVLAQQQREREGEEEGVALLDGGGVWLTRCRRRRSTSKECSRV